MTLRVRMASSILALRRKPRRVDGQAEVRPRQQPIYSDLAGPMMTIMEDSCGWNDTVAGCCSAPSNQLLYGAEHSPGCRENFLAELAKHKLGRRDIVANLNFFCRVPVGADNGLDPLTFVGAPSRPGDHIDLRAEMDVLGAISNCPQINNPCSGGRPTPIRVRVIEAHGG
jgi:uncharacterized protein YcgI (DUF1989 family)